MQIGIITVNYNNQKDTEEFLNSLFLQKGKYFGFIADVSDRSPLKERKGWRNVEIKRLPNKGYAFAVNQGIKFFLDKNYQNFVVLNNDIVLKNNFLEVVKETFKKFDAFTGKIYYAPGFEYYRERYKKNELGKVFWYAGGYIDWKNVYVFHRGVDEVDNGQYDLLEETEFITGCLFCFTKRIVEKVGYWDERFFLYWEDADYSVRILKKGFKLIYNPSIVIWHKNAQSTQGPGSKIHIKYQKKGRLRFALKHANLRAKFHVIKNYILGYE